MLLPLASGIGRAPRDSVSTTSAGCGSGLPRQDGRALLALAAAASACRVPLADLRRPTRGHPRISYARHLGAYLAHVALGQTLTQVGRTIARDRTTIRHACHRIEDARDDRAFDYALSRLEEGLGAVSAAIAQDMTSFCHDGAPSCGEGAR